MLFSIKLAGWFRGTRFVRDNSVRRALTASAKRYLVRIEARTFCPIGNLYLTKHVILHTNHKQKDLFHSFCIRYIRQRKKSKNNYNFLKWSYNINIFSYLDTTICTIAAYFRISLKQRMYENTKVGKSTKILKYKIVQFIVLIVQFITIIMKCKKNVLTYAVRHNDNKCKENMKICDII